MTSPNTPGLTVEQAAQLAGLSTKTITSWIRRGHLTPNDAGLLNPADVWRCARDRRPPAETARLRLAARRYQETA